MANERRSGRNQRSAPARRPAGRRAGAPQKAPRAPRSTAVTQHAVMRGRLKFAGVIVFLVVALLIGRLFLVQVVWGDELSAKAQEQRSRVYVEPARRGEITDTSGRRLAYTMQARSLTVSPTLLRKELREQEKLELEMADNAPTGDALNKELDERVQQRLDEMAEGIPKAIEDSGAASGDVEPKEIMDKLKADTQYEVLVRNVDPDVAATIAETYHGVAADHQDIRQYPNGAIAENVVGKVSMDGQGQFGFEASGDAKLTGIDGRSTEDVAVSGQVIPGSLRDVVPAVDGKDVQLTLDLDLQAFVQQKLEKARANSKAKSGEAVVLDSATGEILAMANTGTIDPNEDIEKQLEKGKHFENRSTSHPYEPGSVAKIITAAAAIEEGKTTPTEVHQVPGKKEMAGVTVADAWQHDVEPYTTTGIFGKSSNVGTLMLAEKLGEKKYDEYLKAFGLGKTTGVELPNESSGLVPAQEQWSGGTFANLPIGQGMSWTTLQMASVYQTLANGGERIEPRIVKSIGEHTSPTDAGDSEDNSNSPKESSSKSEDTKGPDAKKTRVVSEKTAKEVVNMFRATFQDDPAGIQNGTASGNNIEGYQLSGKTGTAQKVDEKTGAYSNSEYWITFAGIAPADDPRFVVAIMLDDPKSGVGDDGQGGQSTAPLFKDIASWLLTRDNIPPSKPVKEPLVLRKQ